MINLLGEINDYERREKSHCNHGLSEDDIQVNVNSSLPRCKEA